MRAIIGFGDVAGFKESADTCLKNLHMIDRIMDVTPTEKMEMEKYVEERNAYWHEKFTSMSNDEWSNFLMCEFLGSLDKRCGREVPK
jgi:hypothetical protein